MKDKVFTIFTVLVMLMMPLLTYDPSSDNSSYKQNNIKIVVEDLLEDTIYDESIKTHAKTVSNHIFNSLLHAEQTYGLIRGNACRIIIEKKLEFLGHLGKAQIKKRCQLQSTRIMV